MDTRQNMEEKLWLYIDGHLKEPEKSVIEKLLETDTVWKNTYRELVEVNSLLKSSALDAPSMRFTRNVMEEISRLHIAPATRTYINKRIIWGIASFFILMLLGILVYGFGQLSTGGGEQTEISKNFEKIDVSKIFSNTWVNVFMMVNVVLGLVFLDHYLTAKRKAERKEA